MIENEMRWIANQSIYLLFKINVFSNLTIIIITDYSEIISVSTDTELAANHITTNSTTVEINTTEMAIKAETSRLYGIIGFVSLIILILIMSLIIISRFCYKHRVNDRMILS
jgi:hypothetical protein